MPILYTDRQRFPGHCARQRSRRSESEGSFFFSFAEDGTYIFYPAFRSFLAAIVQGNESGVFRIGETGAETVDFNRAQALWDRYGARVPD